MLMSWRCEARVLSNTALQRTFWALLSLSGSLRGMLVPWAPTQNPRSNAPSEELVLSTWAEEGTQAEACNPRDQASSSLSCSGHASSCVSAHCDPPRQCKSNRISFRWHSPVSGHVEFIHFPGHGESQEVQQLAAEKSVGLDFHVT